MLGARACWLSHVLESTLPRVRVTAGVRHAVSSARSIAPIKVTERAAGRIKEMLSEKDEEEDIIGVKVSVKKRGCNGYSYQMNYAKPDDLDKKKHEVVDAHGVRVLIDTKAIFFLVGTTMDYTETDIAAEFSFNNPNSKGVCGCGESFTV